MANLPKGLSLSKKTLLSILTPSEIKEKIKEQYERVVREYNPIFTFKTFHVSCRSYRPKVLFDKEQLGGVVLYSYKGKFDWYLSGIHCKAGYIILKKSKDVDHIKAEGDRAGIIHGKVYKSVFGIDIDHHVVGGGFAYTKKNGKWVWKFKSFSLCTLVHKASRYYSNDEEMSIHEKIAVMATIEKWVKTGQQNNNIGEMTLFEDTNFGKSVIL